MRWRTRGTVTAHAARRVRGRRLALLARRAPSRERSRASAARPRPSWARARGRAHAARDRIPISRPDRGRRGKSKAKSNNNRTERTPRYAWLRSAHRAAPPSGAPWHEERDCRQRESLHLFTQAMCEFFFFGGGINSHRFTPTTSHSRHHTSNVMTDLSRTLKRSGSELVSRLSHTHAATQLFRGLPRGPSSTPRVRGSGIRQARHGTARG